MIGIHIGTKFQFYANDTPALNTAIPVKPVNPATGICVSCLMQASPLQIMCPIFVGILQNGS